MYGTQTLGLRSAIQLKFENDVKMYGTQTGHEFAAQVRGLRMM